MKLDTKKIAVIGGGISGVSVGRMLNSDFNVTVFEKGSYPGGLVRCTVEQGFLYHRVGGHVFNSKNKKVLNWFWQFFDREKEFIKTKRNAKILFRNKLINYPVENFIYQLPGNIGKEIIEEIIELLKQEPRSPFDYENFEEFLLNNFGETLYKIYFKPYNEKIWKCNASELPMEWLEDKLPMPDFRKIVHANIFREEEKEMVHSTFFYPKKGGSQFIINRIAEGLKVEINTEIKNIARNQGKWILNNQQEFDHIIYTGDIRKLSAMLGQNMELKQQLEIDPSAFKSNGTTNMLCETDITDLSWMYVPSEKIKAHRIIYTGNFSESNNTENRRKSCVVEFSGKHSEQEILEDLPKLPGNLKPVQMNYEKNSYVIQNRKTKEKIDYVKSVLEPLGMHLLGRFAEWEYYNMDKCIESAMKVVHAIKKAPVEVEL